MLRIDIPTLDEFKSLASVRSASCISLYAPTSPLPEDEPANRLTLKNLAKSALTALREAHPDKRLIARMEERLAPLIPAYQAENDDEHPRRPRSKSEDMIGRIEASGLGVLASPDGLQIFRLAHRPRPLAEVADRFHLTPLIRAMISPQEMFVLALAEESVRLLQIVINMPVQRIRVPGLPSDAEEATHHPSIHSRAPHRRIQGDEGRKTLLRIYAIRIDEAVQRIMAEKRTPMALAGTEPMVSIYRSVSSYGHILDETILGSPDHLSDAQLRDAALSLLGRCWDKEISVTLTLFNELKPRRATTDISYAAHAATIDAIDRLLVDLDAVVPGLVSEIDGSVSYASSDTAKTYSVVDEIAKRALTHGARVLGARGDQLPGRAALAATLRFPF